jgi:hypothetical protein
MFEAVISGLVHVFELSNLFSLFIGVFIGIVILLVYLIILPLIGFLPASFIFYFTFYLYLGDDRFTLKNIAVWTLLTFVVVTGFYIVFHYFLEVPLPTGSWFE